MTKQLTVYDTLRMVEESAEPMAFLNVNTGALFRSRVTDKTTLFDATGVKFPLTRGAYIAMNRNCEMHRASVVIEPDKSQDDEEDEDNLEYPADEDLLEWASDMEGVSDDEVQSFVVNVLGENSHRRSRATNVDKIESYLIDQLGKLG